MDEFIPRLADLIDALTKDKAFRDLVKDQYTDFYVGQHHESEE
jgi:hypothetical protein